MIEVRGPNVFAGYWRMPEKTAEELRDDGFFITGDLGFVDGEGYVQIVGRSKDLIISGGFNVYPKEVETAIDAMEGVLETAVIGVPHGDLGEAVVAVVAARPGAAIGADAIRARARRQAGSLQASPSTSLSSTSLPRNAMGKVQKNVLRERFADILE